MYPLEVQSQDDELESAVSPRPTVPVPASNEPTRERPRRAAAVQAQRRMEAWFKNLKWELIELIILTRLFDYLM